MDPALDRMENRGPMKKPVSKILTASEKNGKKGVFQQHPGRAVLQHLQV